ADTVRNPFPTFAEFRRKGPVLRADIRTVMGVSPDVEVPDDLQAFTAVGYDAVMQVLRDGETFSSSGYAASMGELLGHSILEMDGHRLEDEDIFAFLRLLLPAGAETTYRSSSNLFFALLSNPHMLDAVREDRSLVPQAIEEALRWEPPLTGIVRLSMRETEVC